jgi:hypothetical protein
MSEHLERAKLFAASQKFKAAVDSLYDALPAAAAGDAGEAQGILDTVAIIRDQEPKLHVYCDEIEEAARRGLGGDAPPAPDMRIHITAAAKRQILDWLVNFDPKYSKPFSGGRLSGFSLIGTQSWADYAGVVLQMMIADSLINLEEKLDRLLAETESPSS